MKMEWVEISGEAYMDEIALVAVPDKWFAEWAPYYFAYAHTAEGSVFDSMVFGFDQNPEEAYKTYRDAKNKLKLKMEVQKRDGYVYPVYKLMEG